MDAVYAMFQVNLVAVAHLTHRVLPAHARARPRHDRQQRLDQRLRVLPRRQHLRRLQGRRGRADASRCGASSRAPACGVLHVVTPGVNTDMLDATEEVYGRHMDTSGWDKVEPAEWADEGARGRRGRTSHILGPGGRTAYAKLASRGPAFLLDALSGRMFSRQPRTLSRAAAPAASASIPASGLASTVCTRPIRRSAKPASQ